MRHRYSFIGWNGLAALVSGMALAATGGAQGTVSGRVSIQERSGETTTDYGNAIIYLVPHDSARVRTRPHQTSIAMNGRSFVPHVRVVTPGSRVEFPNQDPFSHNIFSSSPGQVFDLGLYAAGRSKGASFPRPGAYPVYCNIHPRMTAFVVVAGSQWYAQSGNDGRWSIENVPAGRYTLHVWHERSKASATDIVVPVAGLADLATALDARGFRAGPHKNKFGKEYDKTGKDRY